MLPEVAWFVLQLITRATHLKITELELAVGIIALVLNFLTYAFLLYLSLRLRAWN